MKTTTKIILVAFLIISFFYTRFWIVGEMRRDAKEVLENLEGIREDDQKFLEEMRKPLRSG